LERPGGLLGPLGALGEPGGGGKKTQRGAEGSPRVARPSGTKEDAGGRLGRARAT
jgi:hypothetical protein